MKILYGVSGYGYGHCSRASSIIPHLLKQGHEVKIMTYGKPIDILTKKGFDVFPIKGAYIYYRKNKINKPKTLFRAITSLSSNLKNIKKICNLMKNKFDLVISDFEPLSSYLSLIYNIPLISIDNQHLLTNCKVKPPKEDFINFQISKLISRLFIPKAYHYIVINFSNLEIKKRFKKNTTLVPPIIRPEVINSKPIQGDKVLVYFSEKNNDNLNLLKKINQKFVVYGYDNKKNEKNIIFHDSGERFAKDLAECKAVISTSGFSLISEAIFMKKPLLVLPLHGHFEQQINAIFLKESGFGDYSENLSEEKLSSFLDNLYNYNKKLKNFNIDSKKLMSVLDKLIKDIENK